MKKSNVQVEILQGGIINITSKNNDLIRNIVSEIEDTVLEEQSKGHYTGRFDIDTESTDKSLFMTVCGVFSRQGRMYDGEMDEDKREVYDLEVLATYEDVDMSVQYEGVSLKEVIEQTINRG